MTLFQRNSSYANRTQAKHQSTVLAKCSLKPIIFILRKCKNARVQLRLSPLPVPSVSRLWLAHPYDASTSVHVFSSLSPLPPFPTTRHRSPSSNSMPDSPPEPRIIPLQPLSSRHGYSHCYSHSNPAAGHSAVVDNTCPAGGVNLAVGIPAVASRLAGNQAAVGSSARRRGWRLGRQEGDGWAVGRKPAVALFCGCVCADTEMEEHQGQHPF